ncbi:MAG: UDP-N-acetylmuramoyl-L-alanyl-D-glutamate--2,6-diaminopimelate ligase [Candidatus Peribacteraceae bacterium]|nr:UDP-N-acetylmuramoyl-L-alanyl-D-glutamate--2,6-diaminopimelate ligase [Candidatus Peribacteraceae bacterium]
MKRLLRSLKKAIPQRHPLRLAWHHAKAFLAALLSGFPARHLTIIAITGTDGKTTTVGMTAHILAQAGLRVGALSTAFLQMEDAMEWNTTQKTSPSPFLIQRFLRRLLRAGCTHAVLETSSHGLVQGRLRATWPRVAAITNTTPEHLDYHGTLEQYRRDKGLLFAMLRRDGTKVLNRDDGSFSLFAQIPSSHTLTFGTTPAADLSLTDSAESPQGVRGTVHLTRPDQRLPLALRIHGLFNLENALCAIACAQAVGIPPERSIEALRSFPGVPGRMEQIDEGQPFSVFVDFTVTPAAYEKTLTTLRALLPPDKRLLALTGSCGDRMREKRPQVGALCSRLADIVVVTNEDPYTEDPHTIIEEVWAGIDQAHCDAHKIFDRREAMAFLFAKAEPGDAVILCAKGSDTTMMTAEGQIPWDERAIARELLKKMVK